LLIPQAEGRLINYIVAVHHLVYPAPYLAIQSQPLQQIINNFLHPKNTFVIRITYNTAEGYSVLPSDQL
jgi:hypothetical protein